MGNWHNAADSVQSDRLISGILRLAILMKQVIYIHLGLGIATRIHRWELWQQFVYQSELIEKRWLEFNICAAKWLTTVFSSFEAGIANAISSFK